MGGLFSFGPKRIVSVDDVRKHMAKEDVRRLWKVYNHLKRDNGLSMDVFRRTFLPANTPVVLAQKLYNIYANAHHSKQMDFDDFLEVYYLVHSDQTINQKSKKTVD